jgi:membrane fusion protein, multidrug efflux system
MNARPAFTFALALLLAACGQGAEQMATVRPVVVQKVAAGGAAPHDVYPGEIRARIEADLAFRVGGKIVSRAVDAGTRVKMGRELARLDPQDARLALESARANLASAESDATLARDELNRYADLLAKKFISQSAYDQRKNQANAANAKVEQARAQAGVAENQAAYTTLVADADGVITEVKAEPGQVVAAGQAVMRLARDGEREVVINLSEGDVGRFRVGQPAVVSRWADPAKLLPGAIREIAGAADPTTRTYAVRISIPNAPPDAQLGMTANVGFHGSDNGTVVLLPLTSITKDRERGEPAVWVVDPATSKVKLRAVKIGQYREDGVSILAGLEPGDLVVTAGVHKLLPDQQVLLPGAKPAEPTANAKPKG